MKGLDRLPFQGEVPAGESFIPFLQTRVLERRGPSGKADHAAEAFTLHSWQFERGPSLPGKPKGLEGATGSPKQAFSPLSQAQALFFSTSITVPSLRSQSLCKGSASRPPLTLGKDSKSVKEANAGTPWASQPRSQEH